MRNKDSPFKPAEKETIPVITLKLTVREMRGNVTVTTFKDYFPTRFFVGHDPQANVDLLPESVVTCASVRYLNRGYYLHIWAEADEAVLPELRHNLRYIFGHFSMPTFIHSS
jgi:hypothetical protein